MTVRTTRGPDGEEMVLLSLSEYQDLVDARRHEAAMRAVTAGAMATLSEAEAAEFLAARTPVAFWRRQRAMTQRALAEAIGVSQAYVAQIENGARDGRPGVLRDMARVLRVRMEDLID